MQIQGYKSKDLDALHIGSLETLRDSSGWEVVKTRMARMVKVHEEELLTCAKWEDALKLQGAIATVKRCAELPELLIKEAKEKLKNGRHAQTSAR